jgi:hypothetical protein
MHEMAIRGQQIPPRPHGAVETAARLTAEEEKPEPRTPNPEP